MISVNKHSNNVCKSYDSFLQQRKSAFINKIDNNYTIQPPNLKADEINFEYRINIDDNNNYYCDNFQLRRVSIINYSIFNFNFLPI